MRGDWPTADLLHHRAATTPAAVAVVDAGDGSTQTFEELDRRVGALAASLDGTVERGDRVAILMDTRVAFAETYWAVRRLGASVVALNVRLAVPELRDRLDRVDPALLVCERATEDTATELPVDRLRSVDPPTESGVDQLAPAETTTDPRSSGPNTEAAVLFTSGTTGRPKGVRLTVGNLLWSALGSALRLGVSRTDRWLCCLPMYHTGGLAPIVRTAVDGSTLVIQEDFEPGRTATAIEGERITGVSLVPTMLDRLLDHGWEPPHHLGTVLLGGAPASEDLLECALEAGVPVAPTYGLTETASQVATAHPESIRDAPDTVGPPLLPTSVTVVDDAGSAVDRGESGELVVDGPTVTPGYLDEELTADAFGPAGLHTGDYGRMDQTGRLEVHGRMDDLIKTGGETVAPALVVEVLEAHAGVRTAAVVGLSDAEWGERVGALVVPAGDRPPSTDDLRAHCGDQLAGFETPTVWGFTDTLPRTASGTIDRAAARECLVADGQR